MELKKDWENEHQVFDMRGPLAISTCLALYLIMVYSHPQKVILPQ